MNTATTDKFSDVKFVHGAAPRQCQQCGKFFLQYRHTTAQRYCPTCTDVQQMRPSVVAHRELVAEYDGVKIEYLPGEWVAKAPRRDGDDGYFEIKVSGRDLGGEGEWSGRLNIFANGKFAIGDTVKIRHMKTAHVVKALYSLRTTMDGRPVIRRKTLPVQSSGESELFCPAYHRDADGIPDGTERYELEEREYLVFMPTDSPTVRCFGNPQSGYCASEVEFEVVLKAGEELKRIQITLIRADSSGKETWLGASTLERLNCSEDEFEEYDSD